jgi:hypothetical protein
MASIGDLFVSVRAKTQGLDKGLRKANRSIKSFSRSAAGALAVVGAGFLGFKGIQAIFSRFFSALMYHSAEFRTAWIEMSNTLRETFSKLAVQWGPRLARMIESLTIKLILLLESLDAATDPDSWNQLGRDLKKSFGASISYMAKNPFSSMLNPMESGFKANAMLEAGIDPGRFQNSDWHQIKYWLETRDRGSRMLSPMNPIPVKILEGAPQ